MKVCSQNFAFQKVNALYYITTIRAIVFFKVLSVMIFSYCLDITPIKILPVVETRQIRHAASILKIHTFG